MLDPGVSVIIWPVKGIGLAAVAGVVTEAIPVGLGVRYAHDGGPESTSLIPWGAIARVEVCS